MAAQRQPADPRRLERPSKSLIPSRKAKTIRRQRRGRHVVGKLQPRDLGRIHPRPQAVDRVHHQRRSHFPPAPAIARSGSATKAGRSSAVAGSSHLVRPEPLPADRPDLASCGTTSASQIASRRPPRGCDGQRQAGAMPDRDIARLHQRRNRGVGQALIPRQQQRIVRRHHQQRLFKARVEAGQPVDVGRMLAVAIDHQRVIARRRRRRAQRRQPRPALGQRQRGRQVGVPKSRPVDADQVGHGVLPFGKLCRAPLARNPGRRRLRSRRPCAYIRRREVGAGRRLANPVRSGRKQP